MKHNLKFKTLVVILLGLLSTGCTNTNSTFSPKKNNEAEIEIVSMKNVKFHHMAEVIYKIKNNEDTPIIIYSTILCMPLSKIPTGNAFKEQSYTKYSGYYNKGGVYIEKYDSLGRRFCVNDSTERIAPPDVNPGETITLEAFIALDFPYVKKKNYKSYVDYPYVGDFIEP